MSIYHLTAEQEAKLIDAKVRLAMAQEVVAELARRLVTKFEVKVVPSNWISGMPSRFANRAKALEEHLRHLLTMANASFNRKS